MTTNPHKHNSTILHQTPSIRVHGSHKYKNKNTQPILKQQLYKTRGKVLTTTWKTILTTPGISTSETASALICGYSRIY